MSATHTALPLRAGNSRHRTPLAWRNIVHHKPTMLISIAAVAFAVLIMFMEIGFLNGLYDSQTGALASFHADLVMTSPALHIVTVNETFPRARLAQVAAVAGVKAAYPVYMEDGFSALRNPETGMNNSARVFGFEPDHPVFESREVNQQIDRLRVPLTVLFDRKSRRLLGRQEQGAVTELAGRAVTVVGSFTLGPDYYYDGNIFTSAETFFALFPDQKRSEVFIGLIHLERGASAEDVLRELRASLGPDVEVMTKSAIIAREKATLQKSTPAGAIFTMGVAVGFVIGVFICYQILYTQIADHLPQLATLKALGYQNRDLVRLVLTQAVLLGMLGFLPALALTFGLYALLTTLTGIVTKLTLARVVLVFSLTLGMCFVSGLLAVRKALAADPAELF